MSAPTTAQAIHGNIQDNYSEAWHTWMDGLEETLDEVHECLNQARDVQEVCTDEWCEATDTLLDDLHHVLFSISEPGWTSEEDSRKIRDLRKRVRKAYERFEEIVED